MQYLRPTPILVLTLGVILLLTACGGGGGNSTTGFNYRGNLNPAAITANNAARLVGNVIGDTTASEVISAARAPAGKASTGIDQVQLAHRLSRYLKASLGQESARARIAARIRVDEVNPCDSGSVRLTGSLSDLGTGTLELSFNACRFAGETFDGKGKLRIDAFDPGFLIFTDATFSFTSMTLTSTTLNVSLNGVIDFEVLIGANTERQTVNMVTRNNTTGTMTKSENLRIVDVYDNVLFPTSLTETISGRVFDSVYGYVDIDSLTPLGYAGVDQAFPDSGQFRLIGAASASIRVSAVSDTQIQLELDLDGIGGYEVIANLGWAELGGSAGSDLADTDGDGMHNSWELLNGLDPLNPADANRDDDLDGFSNLVEYHAGTDPRDPGSVPPPEADLSISLTDSPDPVAGGSNLNYLLVVVNAGPSAAGNARVVSTLPPGAAFVTASGSGWNCMQAGDTLTCTRPSLAVGTAPTITLAVTAPNNTGDISYTASVSADSADFNQANNSATETTVVSGGSSQVVQIPLATNDIIYDSISGKIYASVPSSAGSIGNSITPIDPASGLVGGSVFIGSEPGPLALSDDGTTLYAGLDGAAAIRQFDLPSQSPGPQFALGSDLTFGRPYYAEDIEVEPGNSAVIAVSLKYLGSSPRHAGVAIFDNGVMRPAVTAGHTGSNIIEYSASAATLYGYNNETTEFGFRTMAVDAGGVSVVGVAPNLISGFGVDITFAGGRIYATDGSVIDPAGPSLAGSIAASGPIAPDAGSGRVYLLDGIGSTRSLRAYDMNTFLLLGSVSISGVNGTAGSLIRWGSNGLAFRTDQDQVFLIQTSLVP